MLISRTEKPVTFPFLSLFYIEIRLPALSTKLNKSQLLDPKPKHKAIQVPELNNKDPAILQELLNSQVRKTEKTNSILGPVQKFPKAQINQKKNTNSRYRSLSKPARLHPKKLLLRMR